MSADHGVIRGMTIVDLDSQISVIETRIWKETENVSFDEEVRRRLLRDGHYHSPLKNERNDLLFERNEIAKKLKIRLRGIHDLDPLKYVQQENGEVTPVS